MIIPATLKAGDCIGIFSPSGPVRDAAKVEAGLSLLDTLGFRVKMSPPPSVETGYLAADDHHRLTELHTLLLDDQVKALLALRGGYGCLRIAHALDYTLFSRARKFIIGFSDVSILLNTISSRTDIVTVHGPVLTSLAAADGPSVSSLRSLLTEGLPEYIAPHGTVILRSGDARGILRGGNLASLVHLIGTPWDIPWEKTLLLLEDTGEPMYKIDRMLTQLFYSGRLDKLSGIILGSFDGGGKNGDTAQQEQVWQRVMEVTVSSGCPVWGNFPVGHLERNIAVPLGVEMSMESRTGCLVLQHV